MFAYGVAVSPVEWTFGRSLTVIFMLFGGTTFFTSLFYAYVLCGMAVRDAALSVGGVVMKKYLCIPV